MLPESTPSYAYAARLLWARIPHPMAKPTKNQKTWKTLEPDRQLRLLVEWFDGKKHWNPGDVFTVCTPITNQGVTLKDPDACTHSWKREWKDTFVKVKKTRKKN